MKTKKIEESIKNKFSLLQNNLTQTNKKNDDLKINQINYEEIKLENGKYVGQIINGIREGKRKTNPEQKALSDLYLFYPGI